jgi:hypothetical protein
MHKPLSSISSATKNRDVFVLISFAFINIGQAQVAHAYHPSYSGGRDREDNGSKPAWANSSPDPILRKPIEKKGWQSDSKCRP